MEKKNISQSSYKCVDRTVLSGIDWLNNPENKQDLIKLVYSCLQTDEDRNLFAILLVIISGENTWRTTEEKIEV